MSHRETCKNFKTNIKLGYKKMQLEGGNNFSVKEYRIEPINKEIKMNYNICLDKNKVKKLSLHVGT